MKRSVFARLFPVLLCLCMVVGFVSCKGETTPEPVSGSEVETEVPIETTRSGTEQRTIETTGKPEQTTTSPPAPEEPTEPETPKTVDTADIDNVDKGWTNGWH